MVAEWKKKGLEKLRERESEACFLYTKNPALTEKEQEAAFEKCIIDVEKLPLEKQLEFIQEVKECKIESKKAKTPKEKDEFEQWCYADIPTNIFAFKSDKNLSFESPAGPFICDWVLESGNLCGKSFPAKSHLELHIDAVHRKLKPHICNELLEDGTVCGQAFARKYDLDQHINAVHRKLKPHICNELKEDGTVCGQAFARKNQLERHIDSVHCKLKPFICNWVLEDGNLCGKSFSAKQGLETHIDAVHRQLKPFICDEILDDGTRCGQAFAEKQKLETHIDAVHRHLKPFICNELREDGTPCGQAFARKQKLEAHIDAVHRKLKPFICNELKEDGMVCGQTFSEKGSLEAHIDAIHRKLKPFICNDLLEDGTPCGQTFPYKTNLERHLNEVHRKLKPFICDELLDDGEVCGQTFASKSHLDRHIDMVHKQVRYVCSKCGKPFASASYRDSHERGCSGNQISDDSLKRKYHIKKGANVEDVVVSIIEQYCEQSKLPTTRQKEFFDPALGGGKVDLFCEGLEGKRVAIDVTTSPGKSTIAKKWRDKRYQEYPEIDELWVVVCSNEWDTKRCADLIKEMHRDQRYQNVYIYHWTDLRNIKMMTIPPKIWKLLEIYEMCTLENKEECKKRWEEAKARFHTF